MTNEQALKTNQPRSTRLRFTFVLAALTLVLFVVALVYSGWARNREREANMPVPAMETVVLALRTFHQQTGKIPARLPRTE